MPDVSIMVSAKDGFSPSIKNMTNSIKGFSKEAEEASKAIQILEKRQESLCDRQAKLRVSLDEAKSSLSDVRKEFRLTGDEVSRLNLENAYKGFSRLSDELTSCKQEIRETDKAMRELNGTQSKNSNRASAEKSMFAALASAGFTKMAGDVLAQGANFYVSSAYGSDAGSIFGSALSSAATGAAMGMTLGHAGAAVGGVIGGVTGLVSGGLNVAQRQDDAFKSAVQNLYDSLTQENVAMVASGINLAAIRKIDVNDFSKMLGGDEMAKNFLDWVKDAAAETPMGYDDLTQMSRRLKTFGYNTEQVKDMLLTIGDTGVGTGSDMYGMQMMINGLGRIKQSGKTNLEYMNPMIERDVPVWDYLQEGLEKDLGQKLTIQEVQKMSSQNEIDAEDAVSYIMAGMKEDFGGLMEEQAKTFTGLASTLEEMRSNVDAAAGEGFTTMRRPAMEEQVEHYDIMGNKYEEAAGISGKLEAVQQNRRERILREKMTAMFEDTDESGYAAALGKVRTAEIALDEAEKSGVQIEISDKEDKLAIALVGLQSIVDSVEAQAETEYMGDNIEKSMQDASKGLIHDIQGFLKKDDTWKAWGYNIGIEMGKGMMSVQDGDNPRIVSGQYSYLTGSSSTPAPKPYDGKYSYLTGGGYAYGLGFVPFDNFPAMLHQGERVLTAGEARAADHSAAAPNITITGNQFTVREEADIERVAAALAYELQKASAIYAY